MTRSVFFLFITVLLFSINVSAQSSTQRPRLPDSDPGETFPKNSDQHSNLPDEMRIRLIIERLEGEHKKFVEDVKELDELSNEVNRSYDERQLLSPEDLKKLANIEKRARRILSYAGGNQVEDKSNNSAQLPLGEALDKMCTAAASIKKFVIKETRHIVSAAVIGSSNEIIDLTRAIRRSWKQNN